MGINFHSAPRCHSPTRYHNLRDDSRKPCSLLFRLGMHNLLPSRMRLAPNPRKYFNSNSLHCLGKRVSPSNSPGMIQSYNGQEKHKSIPRRSNCRPSHNSRHQSPSVYCVCHHGYSLEGKDLSTRALSIPHNTSNMNPLWSKENYVVLFQCRVR